jgi:hypothetical protein
MTSRFDNGEEIANPPLQDWTDIHSKALVDRLDSTKSIPLAASLPHDTVHSVQTLHNPPA